MAEIDDILFAKYEIANTIKAFVMKNIQKKDSSNIIEIVEN